MDCYFAPSLKSSPESSSLSSTSELSGLVGDVVWFFSFTAFWILPPHSMVTPRLADVSVVSEPSENLIPAIGKSLLQTL